jgi:hypothetical protein
MGCSCCENLVPVDKEVKEILQTLDKNYEKLEENFVVKAKDIEDKRNKQLENRRKKLQELKDKNQEITKEILEDLNKKESDMENKILVGEIEKMHSIYELGLDLTEPMKEYSIKKLEKKLTSVPSAMVNKINEEINEIKKLKPIEFLKSTYGKALQDALAKKGMSKTILVKFRKDMVKERKSRREKEKEEFNIKVELKEEDDDFDIDLFSLVEDEVNGEEFQQNCEKKLLKMLGGSKSK